MCRLDVSCAISAAEEVRVPAGTVHAIARPFPRDPAPVAAGPGVRCREPARRQGNRAQAAQLTGLNGQGRERPRRQPRRTGMKRTGDTRFPVIARIRVRKTGPPCARSCRLSPPGTVSRHLPTPAQRASTRQRNARSENKHERIGDRGRGPRTITLICRRRSHHVHAQRSDQIGSRALQLAAGWQSSVSGAGELLRWPGPLPGVRRSPPGRRRGLCPTAGVCPPGSGRPPRTL